MPYMLDNILFSQDPRLIASLQAVCTNVGISPTICSVSTQVPGLLTQRKFYGVMVDSIDPEETTKVLSTFRASSSSRKAIAIAVSDNLVQGAAFHLGKPLSPELAMRTLRVAKGPMLAEFFGYFRHTERVPVLITKGAGGELRATSINVSLRGLAVQISGSNRIGINDAIHAMLTLPGGTWTEMKGKVVWADNRGRLGIRCDGITPRDKQQLKQWLAASLPRT